MYNEDARFRFAGDETANRVCPVLGSRGRTKERRSDAVAVRATENERFVAYVLSAPLACMVFKSSLSLSAFFGCRLCYSGSKSSFEIERDVAYKRRTKKVRESVSECVCECVCVCVWPFETLIETHRLRNLWKDVINSSSPRHARMRSARACRRVVSGHYDIIIQCNFLFIPISRKNRFVLFLSGPVMCFWDTVKLTFSGKRKSKQKTLLYQWK